MYKDERDVRKYEPTDTERDVEKNQSYLSLCLIASTST